MISDRFWLENLQTCFYTIEHSMEDLEKLRNCLRHNLKAVLLSDSIERKLLPIKEKGIFKVVIFGASGGGRAVLKACMGMGINVVAFCDNDEKKQGNGFMDKPVIPPSKIERYTLDGIIIGSAVYQEDIYRQIKGLKDKGIEIIKLW